MMRPRARSLLPLQNRVVTSSNGEEINTLRAARGTHGAVKARQGEEKTAYQRKVDTTQRGAKAGKKKEIRA